VELFEQIRKDRRVEGSSIRGVAGRHHVPGAAPEDGFSGYNFFQEPVPGVARWGDYSAAVFADGAVWMANEFIPSTPRSLLADWGTFITKLPS